MLTTQQLYTFEDYLKYDDDTDKRYELVDGRLELMNPPTFRHLLIADFINNTFDAEIKRLNVPWWCFQEAGVRTGPRKSRLTDIYILRKDQVIDFLDCFAITETTPILTVEVVSPDSIKRDYRYKRSE